MVKKKKKKSASDAGDPGSIPGSWVGKIPWRRKWQPAPVFLPGKSHEQRNPAGYSPGGCKETDTTERLRLSTLSEEPGQLLGRRG